MPQPINANHEFDDPDPGRFMHLPSEPSAEDRDLFGKVPKKHRDWSHRRGEPRMFAIFWMVYLMGATVLMFSSMARAFSISTGVTRPAARTMLVVVFFGIVVLWPMVRISQQIGGRSHVGFVLRDIFVLVIPLQAVLWPQTFDILASWPVSVVLALTLFSLAWVLVIAGIIALAMGSIERAENGSALRGIWMLLFLLIAAAAPLVGLLGMSGKVIGIDQPRVGWLLSPISGVLELTRDRSGLGTAARVYPQHWRMIIAIACVGLALLLIARAMEVARSRYPA